jgi:predicted ATPase
MLITEFKIINYKSYRATTPIQLSTGFNVFIGKNNGGKTALLEALSLSTLVNKPHRHSGIPREQLVQPMSSVELIVTLAPADFRRAFLSADSFFFPVPAECDEVHAMALLHEFLQEARSFCLRVHANQGFRALSYPFHGMFAGPDTGYTAEFRPNAEKSDFQLVRFQRNNNDTGYLAVGKFVAQSVYSFRAERLSLATHQYGDTLVLVPNAQNLPVVLNVLQSDHERFERFIALVEQVFPSIRRVSVRPRSGSFEIIVWNADAPAERDDLVIELAESGTGIGQVLAMLYIIVTSQSPRTIIIDEPNIFLHPGAMRQLVEIMRADPIGHQYIVTTHSPEIIRATDAKRIYSVERQDEQSYIRPLSSGDIISFRRTLLEVGARLSDLFGADNILWVEGSTEEECFPKIIQARSVETPAGLAIIAVRATGDFEGRRAHAVAIWEIYNRLSTVGTLMPVTLAIILDTEDRSEADIEKAKEISGGLMHFLPRRCFENYLIHPPAITAILNTLPSFLETPTTEPTIEAWLRDHGGDTKYDPGKMWNGDARNGQWLISVKGALLLHDLFQALSNVKEEYHKVEHGAALTEWICGHQSEHFAELAGYIQGLMK